MFYSNAHTHSTWCDGKDSLEDMAQAAIDLGFTVTIQLMAMIIRLAPYIIFHHVKGFFAAWMKVRKV